MLFHSPRSLPMTVPPSTSFHQDGFFVAKLKKTSNKVPATERKGRWIRGLQERCFWHCLMVWGQKESRRIDPKWKTKCGARTDLTATAFGFARAHARIPRSQEHWTSDFMDSVVDFEELWHVVTLIRRSFSFDKPRQTMSQPAVEGDQWRLHSAHLKTELTTHLVWKWYQAPGSTFFCHRSLLCSSLF